jgi:hypothetical protein
MGKIKYDKKTREEKTDEIRRICDKLSELKLDLTYPPIKEFYKKLQEYIDKDYSVSGKIRMEEYKRTLIYNLPQRYGCVTHVEMKHDESSPF